MPQYFVTMTSMPITAATREEAIAYAQDHGGNEWQAVDPERTGDKLIVVLATLAKVSDAVRLRIGVEEWDNGFFYDHYNVLAIRPDGSDVLVEFDVDHPWHEIVEAAMTELSEADGPLGRDSSLTIEVTDEHRSYLCWKCQQPVEFDGTDDEGTRIWCERVDVGMLDANCPTGGTHEPAGGRDLPDYNLI